MKREEEDEEETRRSGKVREGRRGKREMFLGMEIEIGKLFTVAVSNSLRRFQ